MSFKAMMEPVARDLLGDPPDKQGTDWRYGKKGSLSVDVGKGVWYDYEAGTGGGVVALVKHERQCDGAEAIDYLETLTGEQIKTNGEDHHQKDVDGAREAWRIYAEAVEELPAVARKYFEKRGLNVLETFPGLRWSKSEHALVIPIGPTSVQRIKIDHDGNKVAKMSRGPMEGGWHLKRDGAKATFITEGPEDAMTCFQAFETAEAIAACGEGRLEAVAPMVRTKHVIIVKDANTKPEYLRGLTTRLRAQERTVYGVDMPEGRADINEVQLKDGGVDAVRAVLETKAPIDEEDLKDGPQPHVLVLTDWSVAKAYSGPAPEDQPVVRGLFMKQTAALQVAVGGAGKTDTAIDLGLRIVMNENGDQSWLGYPVESFGSVVMLTAEDNQGAIHQRIEKLQPIFSMSSLADKLIVVPIPNVDGLGSAALFDQDAQPTDLFHRIEEQLAKIGDVQAFIPDPLRAFCRADINASPDMANEVLVYMNRFATRQKLLALINHHLRKAGLQATTALEAREAIQGVAGIVDHARAVFTMWMPPEDEAQNILRELSMEQPHQPFMRVFKAGLVKWNHRDADSTIKTLVRNKGETLIDVTGKLSGGNGEMTPEDHRDKKFALLGIITRRAEAGRPFTYSNRAPHGILSRDGLNRLVHNSARIGGKKVVNDLIDSLELEGHVKFVKEGNSTLIKPT